MVDALVSAKHPCFVQFPRTSGCGNDAGVEEFGNLNSGAADPAARAPDQHCFAKAQPAVGDQHVPRGEKHEWDGSRLFEREVRGLREHVRFGNSDKLRIGPIPVFSENTVVGAQVVLAGDAVRADTATDSGCDHDLSAGLDFRYGLAHPLDDAGGVGAGDVWNGETEAWEPLTNPKVDMVQRRSPDSNEHIAGADRCHGHFLDLGNLWTAVRFVNYSLHLWPPIAEPVACLGGP